MCYLKQRHSTVLQDLQKLHSTLKEILQDSSILHYKGSLSRKLFYIQKAKRSSIDSTYRRQRDFHSNHPAVHIHVCYKAFQRHYRTFKTFIHSKAILHASRTSRVPPHYSFFNQNAYSTHRLVST